MNHKWPNSKPCKVSSNKHLCLSFHGCVPLVLPLLDSKMAWPQKSLAWVKHNSLL